MTCNLQGNIDMPYVKQNTVGEHRTHVTEIGTVTGLVPGPGWAAVAAASSPGDREACILEEPTRLEDQVQQTHCGSSAAAEGGIGSRPQDRWLLVRTREHCQQGSGQDSIARVLCRMTSKSREVMSSWRLWCRSLIRELRQAHYEVLRTIRWGGFASIKLAKHLPTDSLVAVKILNKRDIECFASEVDILKSVEHKNIVKLFEVVETRGKLYLVMEYIDGDLADHVQKVGRLEEEEARPIFWQILRGVKYCHDNGIAHRDLKAENILLDTRGTAKLCDFGLSTRFLPRQLLDMECGTMAYWPPEMFKQQRYQGPKLDVWSLGVLLYYMVMGVLPYDGRSRLVLKEQVVAGIFKVRESFSPELRGILAYMMRANPNIRPTVWQVMYHPWFRHHEAAIPSPRQEVQEQPDPAILKIMSTYLGFAPEEVREALSGRKFNAAMATFQILQQQQDLGQDLACLVRRPLPGPPPCPSPVHPSCRYVPFKRASAPVRHPAASLPAEQQQEEGGRKFARSVCLPFVLWSRSTSITDGETEDSQPPPAPPAATVSLPMGQPTELICMTPEQEKHVGSRIDSFPAPKQEKHVCSRAESLPDILYNTWTRGIEGERAISSAAPHLETSVQEWKDPGETEERSEPATKPTAAETPTTGTEGERAISSAAPHLETSVQEWKDPGETEERSEPATKPTAAETPTTGTEAAMGGSTPPSLDPTGAETSINGRGRHWKRLKKCITNCLRKMCCCCLPGREL
ncbi:sperm motility kinase 4A-like [Perognathus longimembris pacificus]|uniref:sperm motility kinase 4A-like n=1 Tax=Perognathus longimembris pacificus TaxID=214514 RepID=UPI0020194677|nr:sperm motility kinase 4A-like [Perognathus longimembris pacificus]